MSTDRERRGEAGVPNEVLELLGKKYTLRLLEATSDEVRSVRELVDDFDIPKTTVYRRLESLEGHDLVVQRERFDLPGGAHHYAFESNLRMLHLEEDDGDYAFSLERHEPTSRA